MHTALGWRLTSETVSFLVVKNGQLVHKKLFMFLREECGKSWGVVFFSKLTAPLRASTTSPHGPVPIFARTQLGRALNPGSHGATEKGTESMYTTVAVDRNARDRRREHRSGSWRRKVVLRGVEQEECMYGASLLGKCDVAVLRVLSHAMKLNLPNQLDSRCR